MKAASNSMPWPPIDDLMSDLSLANGITLRLLCEEDLPTLPGQLLEWYPAVRVGSESVFLSQEFLHRAVVRQGNLAPDIYAFFLVQDNAVVGFMSFERQPANGTLHARLGVLAPSARTGFLGALGFLAFERLGTRCGAELLLAWITLASRNQQMFAERRGFRLVGVVPGFDRDQVHESKSLRVAEALVAKLLVGTDELLEPLPENLTPRTLRLLETVRKSS